MLSLIRHLKRRWGFLVLTAILLGVFTRNFPTSEQWLIGWDALNPELNFWMNLKYAINSAWQPHYGTGALIGHGYAATLPHVLITGFLKLLMPTNTVRPVFIFACWYLGAVGMYLLLVYLFHRVSGNKKANALSIPQTMLAIAGALFYIFNLGTTQIFYHPLEAFTVQFALIPWALLLIERYFDKPSYRRLLLLFLAVFIGSIQGFIPSSFVAFMVLVVSFLLVKIVGRDWRQRMKRAVLVLFTVILANSYWLPPFVYYTLSNNQAYLESYQNQISTPQFVAKTAKYGTLGNVISLNSFFLEGSLFGEDVFAPWLQFMESYPVQYWYYLIFSLAVVSSLLIWHKKNRFVLAYLIPAVFFFGTLATQTQGFAELNTTLYKLLPLYEQAFRTAFTKVGPIYFALLTILSWVALYWVITKLRPKILRNLLSSAILILVFATVWPHIQGHSFYKQLKVELPSAYSELISFFDRQSGDGYVADLPIGCPDGWYSYNWGYSGSGFYWYGIEQPFLSRAFDVWNQYNESYYWQATRAIRESDFVALDAVFDKYQIKWILIDENLEHCRSSRALEYIPDLKDYLAKNDEYQQTFFSDQGVLKPITIFEKNISYSEQSVRIISRINPVTDKDYLFSTQQPYVENMDVSQAYQTLFSQKNNVDNTVSLVIKDSTASAELRVFNTIKEDERYVSVPVKLFNLNAVLQPEPCLADNHQNVYEQVIGLSNQVDSVRVETKQDSDCISFWVDARKFSKGGIITFDSFNYYGLPFKLTITDNLSQVYLERFVQSGRNAFIIPPASPKAESISFSFSSQAYGGINSDNILKDISLATTNTLVLEQFFAPKKVDVYPANILTLERQRSYYHTLKVEDQNLIILPISYNPAWLALAHPTQTSWWQLDEYQHLPHYRYNGWANAWQVPGCDGQENQNCEHQIIIFYWPQILSWGGYVLLITSGITLLFLCTKNQKHNKPIKNKKIKHLAHKTKRTLAPTK